MTETTLASGMAFTTPVCVGAQNEPTGLACEADPALRQNGGDESGAGDLNRVARIQTARAVLDECWKQHRREFVKQYGSLYHGEEIGMAVPRGLD